MRRSECIKWPMCSRPNQAGVRNTEDYRHNEPYIYYQARSQIIMSQGHDVLNIDIFDGFVPAARYFADRETGSHTALILATGEWTGCILQNVVNKCAGLAPNYNEFADMWGTCCRKKWTCAETEDEKRINDYFRVSGRYALESWESRLQRARRERQIQNKYDRINTMLASLTPALPEDFYRWIHEDIFGKKYLFQKRTDGSCACTCTACGRTWQQKKPVGAGKRICPECGNTVQGTYKDNAEERSTLFVLQPCTNRKKWVERIFNAWCTWEPGRKPFVKLDEVIRIIIPSGGSFGTCFYENGISDGQPLYWDANRDNLHAKAGYLYPGTLQECSDLWPEALRNAGLQLLAARKAKCNYNNIILRWHREPYFEYLVKGGYDAMIEKLCASQYGDTTTTGLLRMNSQTQQELFKIDGSRLQRLRQMGGDFRTLSWLQYEQETDTKTKPENMEFLKKHFWANDREVQEALKTFGSPNIFANYIRRQSRELKETPSSVLRTWQDYMNMAEKQGLNITHEMFYKPKNLKEAHDACVRESQMEEGRKRAAGILQKFPEVENNLDAVRDKYTYAGDRFCIVVPDGIPDIIHEGRALGHCIDSTDRYFDRINQNISYLVFLRRTSAPTVPWYTLEIEPGGTIRQQRTTGNNQNKKDVDEYTPFIQEWQAEVRKRMTQEDRINAARSRNIRQQEYSELRKKKEKVWHGKLAGALLADVLEADLIENTN